MASLVEMFREPIGVIQKRFRTSELVLLAWQSRERAANFEKRINKKTEGTDKTFSQPKINLPDVFDEGGSPDLRKMTGEQQLAFLAASGLAVPISPAMINKGRKT